MIKNVLVTGGTGVTGNALVNYLLHNDIEVTALVRHNSFRKKFLPNDKRLSIVDCDMEDYKNIDSKLSGQKYDVFFHLSWDGSTGKQKVDNRNNFKLQNKNVEYAIDAVELCHKLLCPVFVMTGSQAEYGRRDFPITEETVKKPENGYGMAKLCAEGMTRLLCRKYGIKHIWPILFSVYGPNDLTESLIDTTLRKLINKKEKLSYTKGEQKWDYLYSYDAAKALLFLAEHGKDGEFYNVSNSINTLRIKDYITKIYDILDIEQKPVFGGLDYQEGKSVPLLADNSKLCADTGFYPEYDFDRGIKEIIESIINEKEL